MKLRAYNSPFFLLDIMSAKLTYQELYARVQNMKPRTMEYYHTVAKMLHAEINKEALQVIRDMRKNERYKQGKTITQAVTEYQAGLNYENFVVERARKIFSGEYLDYRLKTYQDNYLLALISNGVSEDIIKYLDEHRDIIDTGGLPLITDFYVPKKGHGDKYSLNIDNMDDLEQELRTLLVNAYGAKELYKE